MLENAIGMRIKMYSGFIDFIMKNICLIIYSLAVICMLDKHTKIKSMISHENKKWNTKYFIKCRNVFEW